MTSYRYQVSRDANTYDFFLYNCSPLRDTHQSSNFYFLLVVFRPKEVYMSLSMTSYYVLSKEREREGKKLHYFILEIALLHFIIPPQKENVFLKFLFSNMGSFFF